MYEPLIVKYTDKYKDEYGCWGADLEIQNPTADHTYERFLLWIKKLTFDILDISVQAAEGQHLGYASGYFTSVIQAFSMVETIEEEIEMGAHYHVAVRCMINDRFCRFDYYLGDMIFAISDEDAMPWELPL